MAVGKMDSGAVMCDCWDVLILAMSKFWLVGRSWLCCLEQQSCSETTERRRWFEYNWVRKIHRGQA